jgi:hypothetical protein
LNLFSVLFRISWATARSKCSSDLGLVWQGNEISSHRMQVIDHLGQFFTGVSHFSAKWGISSIIYRIYSHWRNSKVRVKWQRTWNKLSYHLIILINRRKMKYKFISDTNFESRRSNPDSAS